MEEIQSIYCRFYCLNYHISRVRVILTEHKRLNLHATPEYEFKLVEVFHFSLIESFYLTSRYNKDEKWPFSSPSFPLIQEATEFDF